MKVFFTMAGMFLAFPVGVMLGSAHALGTLLFLLAFLAAFGAVVGAKDRSKEKKEQYEKEYPYVKWY